MKYDGFTPGETDLSLGVAELLRLSREADFPFLLANLVDRRSQKPVFTPYIIKETGGMKIGIFGLISDTFHLRQSTGDREKYMLTNPVAAAGKAAAELKGKGCEIVICLAHMEESEQKKLAQGAKGIHFILSGHVRNLRPETQEVNNVEILKAGTRGEYLGHLEFFTAEKRLYSQYRIIQLDKKYADDHPVAVMLEAYKNRLRALLPEADRAQLEPSHDSRPAQAFSFALPSFAGDQGCLSCHPKQSEAWTKTAHARAWETLEKTRRTSDPTCLPCHTTAFGVAHNPGGILKNVQCEACHGPRKGHPEMQEELFAVTDEMCRKCHTPAKSPTYHYEEFLAKVRCPAG